MPIDPRVKAFVDGDFPFTPNLDDAKRTASAAEYAAYHLGQIVTAHPMDFRRQM